VVAVIVGVRTTHADPPLDDRLVVGGGGVLTLGAVEVVGHVGEGEEDKYGRQDK